MTVQLRLGAQITGETALSARTESLAFIPRLSTSLAVREHLIERVDAAARPLAIVRAPGGSGKTTAIAAWASARSLDGVWVTLDRSAASRMAFWQRVVTAIKDAGLASKGSILQETVVSTDGAETLRITLLRGFAELGTSLTLVLDDYHEVTDARVHDDLHWLLQSGADLRIVIGTRTVSDLEDPLRMATVDTGLILASDLTFTLADTVSAAAALDISPAAAPDIQEAFAGWPLPTRAALIEMGSGRAESASEAVSRVERSGIGVALDRTDDDYMRFLLRGSVAKGLTEDLAREFGTHDAASSLARAERDGLGAWVPYADRSEFVFHPYLRQHLEAELNERFPEDLPGLRLVYARDRAENGDPLEAVRQFAAIGDLGSVVTLLRRHYGDLVFTHGQAIAEVLRAADQAELRHHPELLTMLLLTANTEANAAKLRGLQLASLVLAATQARLGRGTPVDRFSLLLAMLAAQRLGGHYEQAIRTAEQLAGIAAVMSEEDREALRGVLPNGSIHIAATHLYNGELDRAEADFRIAVDIARTVERPWSEVQAASMLTFTVALRGDMAETRRLVEGATRRLVDGTQEHRRPQGWRGTYASTGYHLAEATLALERFDGPRAREELAALAIHEATLEHWPFIAQIRAHSWRVEGRPYLGLHALDRDIALHSERPPISRAAAALLETTRAELLLADRQPHRAAEVLKPLRHRPEAQSVLARLHLASGRPDVAVGLAAPLAWSTTSTPRLKADTMLTVAAASWRLDRIPEAQDALRRAVDLLTTHELRSPLLVVPRADLASLAVGIGLSVDDLLGDVPEFAPPIGDWSLSPGELRVLAELLRVDSVDELAGRLQLSSNTVKTHLKRIYRKLGVGSRTEAIALAQLHGLLPREEQR
jgi:LuxR family maltose regulon positive regulatory protein